MSHVSCLMSPVSHVLSQVFCLMSPVTCLLSHVSCLTSPVLHVVSLFIYNILSELVVQLVERQTLILEVWSSSSRRCLFFPSVLKIPKSDRLQLTPQCVLKYQNCLQLMPRCMLKYQNCPYLMPESILKIPKLSSSITGRMLNHKAVCN